MCEGGPFHCSGTRTWVRPTKRQIAVVDGRLAVAGLAIVVSVAIGFGWALETPFKVR